MAVVGGRQERGPAVLGRLIHVGAGVEQDFCLLEIALARGERQRRQATAPAPHQARDPENFAATHLPFGMTQFRRSPC